MTVTLVRYAEVAATPWKNLLGVTKQLAIHPRDATPERFEWRVSIAQLKGSSDFSKFDGITRCLAMLEGEMTLVREGRAPATLTPESTPISFAGDAAVQGCVEREPALDLNLMYRSSQWRAAMHRVQSASELVVDAQPVAMLCALVATDICIGDASYDLRRFDLVLIESVGRARITSARGIHAYAIELQETLQ